METKLQNVQTLFSELCDQTYDNDTYSVHEMLIDITTTNIEVILKFKRYIIPKIQTMVTAFNAAKLDVDAVKQELEKKKEELKSVKECSKCSTLQKELAIMKKKQVINESRIKSIAKILTRCDPESQDLPKSSTDSDTDSDHSTVTKAYNLVSQMLGCDPLPSIESECGESEKVKTSRKPFKKKSPYRKNLVYNSILKKKSKSNSQKDQPITIPENCEESEDSEDDILVCSLEEINKENDFETYVSPKKGSGGKSASSPVLGKMKKTPVRNVSGSPNCAYQKMKSDIDKLEEHNLENSFLIPASPGKVSSRKVSAPQPIIQLNNDKDELTDGLQKSVQSTDKPKPKADFWQLKSTHSVDRHSMSAKKDGAKLRQSKLSLGCYPKKIDLCDLEEFNGGIRRSQTSTQISDIRNEGCGPSVSKTNTAIKHFNANDDDIVMDSPDTNLSSSRRKGGRLFGSGRKLSFDVAGGKAPGPSEISKSLRQSGNQRASSISEQGAQEEAKGINDSFDCVKKGTVSPKYKYRGAPVRKKNERQQLSGWDCENCKKYYEAAGGDDATEEELKKLMDRCSRHRDKNPVRPRTPPGFWNAEFPPTPDCEELNRTYMDVLPIPKRSKTKP